MTLKEILIAGKLTISEGGGGGGGENLLDRRIDGTLEALDTDVPVIKEYSLYGCKSLKSINAPNATLIEGNAFAWCVKVESINLPKVTQINVLAFSRISEEAAIHPTIVLPALTTLQGRANFDRGRFEAIDIGPNCDWLPSDCFYHNTGLQILNTLILRRTASIVRANSEGAVNGARDVYVPNALIESYKTAANWSTRFDAGFLTFHAIEGSPYETAYADGTPIA